MAQTTAQKLVKQTRRSISVRGVTYDTLRKFCDDSQRSMSDVIEELLGRLFDKAGMAPIEGKSAVSPKAMKAAKQMPAAVLASEKTRKVTAPQRKSAIANRVARMPHVSAEEAEAIRKKYSIPTGNEKTTQMGRPEPTPVAQYVKKEREVAPAKDYRGIRF